MKSEKLHFQCMQNGKLQNGRTVIANLILEVHPILKTNYLFICLVALCEIDNIQLFLTYRMIISYGLTL